MQQQRGARAMTTAGQLVLMTALVWSGALAASEPGAGSRALPGPATTSLVATLPAGATSMLHLAANEQPVGAAPAHDRRARLTAAQTWMYQLQGLDEDGAIDALAATNYPLLVLEPGHNFTEDRYDTAAMLHALRPNPAGGERLLLAYIDIGRAEDYRDYWASEHNAALVYQQARAAELRPLVTRVSLSRMTVTPAGDF